MNKSPLEQIKLKSLGFAFLTVAAFVLVLSASFFLISSSNSQWEREFVLFDFLVFAGGALTVIVWYYPKPPQKRFSFKFFFSSLGVLIVTFALAVFVDKYYFHANFRPVNYLAVVIWYFYAMNLKIKMMNKKPDGNRNVL